MKLIPYNHARWKSFFFTIWGGQVFSLIGSKLVDFALVWYMTETTGSGTVLATGTIVSMLPFVLLGPLLGSLVDRWNRRLIIMVADGIVAAFTLLTMALFWSGVIQIWHIYILLFVRSLAESAHGTAMFASTSLMVPEDQLTRVAGINQAVRGIIQVVSPPLGALLLGIMPIHAVLLIDVGTAALAIAPLVFILIPEPQKRTADGEGLLKTTVFKDLVQGFRYIRSWPGLLTLMAFSMIANLLFNPAMSLSPLLITEHFMGGVFELGWVQTAVGVGMIAGSLILGVWGGFKKRMNTVMSGAFCAGISILLVAFAPSGAFWLGVVGFFLLGGMLAIMNAPMNAIFQAKIAPDMQGRVLSLFDSAGNIIAPIGLAIAGPLTDIIGVRLWFFVAGFGMIALILVGFNLPALMNLEENGAGSKLEHAEYLGVIPEES
jgi:DHA3 family macrolide efflux protein-like MFS transporter